jgi:hypothetical protein
LFAVGGLALERLPASLLRIRTCGHRGAADIRITEDKERIMGNQPSVSLLTLTLVACIGVLFGPIAAAGERPTSISYVGFGYYTSADTNYDGFPVGLSLADANGSLGPARSAITSEWYISPRVCREGYDLPFALVNSSFVLTFSDQSQLFGSSQDGWLCLNSTTGAHYGETVGVYNGGTGRFEGATGEWTTTFDGVSLDPSIGFRTIRGTGTGTLVTK